MRLRTMIVTIGGCALLAACTGGSKEVAPRSTERSAAAATQVVPDRAPAPSEGLGGTRPEAHADHEPRHGGLVFMDGDAHLEALLDPAGDHRVWFSNAVREPLLASFASTVKIIVLRPGKSPEALSLARDATDALWQARGKPVAEVGAKARIEYTRAAGDETYSVEVTMKAAPAEVDRAAAAHGHEGHRH